MVVSRWRPGGSCRGLLGCVCCHLQRPGRRPARQELSDGAAARAGEDAWVVGGGCCGGTHLRNIIRKEGSVYQDVKVVAVFFFFFLISPGIGLWCP